MSDVLLWVYLSGWAIVGLTPVVMQALGRWSSDDAWVFVPLGVLWPLLIVAAPVEIAEYRRQRRDEIGPMEAAERRRREWGWRD